ncbi:hypothetical protein CSIM01_06136 [Colletotrichum simmondsii]|uniref:Xylanolytic transcriptional activator regulatory domain-containing protein n=1 Tax=Colletotrichum simmondsii TaxID=703756 RepID=A0A135SN67_9PEZI|nr:hypothetical protein CSIM01_06136 [Colletotrichum simmondsii]
MNFYPIPPIIQAELYVRIPDELRCHNQETEWRGGFARQFQHIFLEGPIVDDLGNLYVVDIPYGRILKIDPKKTISVVAEWDGEPNGLAATDDGRLVIADYKQGILSFDPSDRKIKPLITRRHLERFKGPNDLIVDSKGSIYFTDQGQTGMTDPTGKVYRLLSDGKLETLVENGVSPNGLVLSPDERFLFVAMTRSNQVWRLPLHSDGTTTKAGVFFQSFGNAGPDGLAIDEEGSLFICHPSLGSVFVVDSNGIPKARIKIRPSLSQIAWRGKFKSSTGIVEAHDRSQALSDSATSNFVAEKKVARAGGLKQLERQLTQDVDTLPADEVQSCDNANQPAADTGPTVISIENSTVSHGEGLGFMASLFADPDLRSNNTELLQLLARVPSASEPILQPCGPPSEEEGNALFDKYLSWSHVQSPFLRRDEVKSLCGRVFSHESAGQPASIHDLFRAFMILAIGSVLPFLNGTHDQHPEGYYLAALQRMGSDFLTRGLASIQDLLLICRFGIYHRIGTSIWDVVRLCGRLCIEQRLHHNDNDSTNFMQVQMKRRVFWQVYMIDRYSSTVLGKPFSIDDRDIEVGFPADANDEDIVTANQISSDFEAFRSSHVTLATTEMTVFFISVRLRQISSRIHSEFSRLACNYLQPSKSHLAPGHIFQTLGCLMQDLQHWRDDCPVFQLPKCLYESQDWYDLLLAREQLYLVRRAIDLMPKRGGKTPHHISVLCLKIALRTIWAYSKLCQQRPLTTHTRSYFHMMFTAGLSVLFCVSTATKIEKEGLSDASAGLIQCEETLKNMAEKLPSAKQYVAVFEALRRNTTRKLEKVLGTLQSDVPSQGKTLDYMMAGSRQSSERFSEPLAASGSSILDSQCVLGPSALGASLDAAVQVPAFPGSIPSNLSFVPPVQRATMGNPTTLSQGSRNTDGPIAAAATFSPGSDFMDWALLGDEALWNMESVVGEYVYGDPERHIGALDAFEFQ